ncbi:MAG: hypothetical protein C0408_06115 [Odoribacter sp.]|nr:hypothetical protein [Odoribacter sp.]
MSVYVIIKQHKKVKMKKNVTNLQISGNIMKILSLTIMLAFIAPLMTNAQAGKANFAGNWIFNAEKSNIGQAPAQGQAGGQRGGFSGGNFVAKQETNLLTTERTRTGQDGTPQVTVMKYTLDGKESVNASGRGDSKSVATWSADGKTLTIVTARTINMNGESREVKTTEVWTLTNAKTLSIKTSRPGMGGETTTTTSVYELK